MALFRSFVLGILFCTFLAQAVRAEEHADIGTSGPGRPLAPDSRGVMVTIYSCNCSGDWTCSGDNTIHGNVTSVPHAPFTSISENQAKSECRKHLESLVGGLCHGFGSLVLTDIPACTGSLQPLPSPPPVLTFGLGYKEGESVYLKPDKITFLPKGPSSSRHDQLVLTSSTCPAPMLEVTCQSKFGGEFRSVDCNPYEPIQNLEMEIVLLYRNGGSSSWEGLTRVVLQPKGVSNKQYKFKFSSYDQYMRCKSIVSK